MPRQESIQSKKIKELLNLNQLNDGHLWVIGAVIAFAFIWLFAVLFSDKEHSILIYALGAISVPAFIYEWKLRKKQRARIRELRKELKLDA